MAHKLSANAKRALASLDELGNLKIQVSEESMDKIQRSLLLDASNVTIRKSVRNRIFFGNEE